MDWDDIRFYLAVARHGSIRGASGHLSVNASTVARRVDAYEKKIGVRLFERLPSGYVLTKTGQDMMASAELIENEIASLDRRVTGRDSQLDGTLRITLPAPFATNLLMDDIAEFEQQFPGIQIDLHVSYDVLNLSKREADVAIRITDSPDEHLVGKKVGKLAFSVYGSVDYLSKHDIKMKPHNMKWLKFGNDKDITELNVDSQFQKIPVSHTIADPSVLFHAIKAGMGVGTLACFMGDADPALQRICDEELQSCGDIWLLSHKDLRTTARVKVFIEFMSNAFMQHQRKLSGEGTIKRINIWQPQSQSA